MSKKIVLAYSGGLDTSFCIPYLKKEYGAEVHAVFVDTMGYDTRSITAIESKAMEYGADHFECIDAFDELYSRFIAYLIKGNVLRDRTYPLSVGAERFIQAEKIVDYAKSIGSNLIAHGSTGAGNDQIRFDIAIRAKLNDVEIITPIRDLGLTRADTTKYLRDLGFEIKEKTTSYSINEGIWGTTIGGKETTTAHQSLPFDAFPTIGSPSDYKEQAEELTIGFEQGLPVSVQGSLVNPRELLKILVEFGRKHGIGRGMHLGDTILGIKGRIGFEAPASQILYFSHRELEKLVLTKWQRHYKDMFADVYGMLLHEGQYYDPVMRDIESYFDHSQLRVNGEVTIYIGHNTLFHLKSTSAFTLMDNAVARYGEVNNGWTGEESRAFAKLNGLTSKLANQSIQ